MNNAPQVQSLADIMAELNPAYAATTDVIGKQRAGLGAKYDTQRTALGAEKTQGFNQINNQATGRGMSFTGIPLDEQSTYLSTKYLPAYAKTFTDQNDEDLAYQKEAAGVQRDVAGQALSYRGTQQSALNAWNLQTMQQQFQAQQNDLDRKASAANAASGRAAEAGPTASQYLASEFSRMGSDANWRKNGATENSGLVGNLMANYGYSLQQAKDLVYPYRKQVYGF
jgi:hypothetical protein